MKTYTKALWLLGALALAAAAPGCKEEPPTPAKIHLQNGDKHRVAKEWKQAAEEYGKSLEADPTQDKVWETKAYCHQQDGDMDATAATLVKMAESKKDPVEKAKLMRTVANLWMQKGDMKNAEASFLEAVKLLPTDDESLSWLGEIHSQRGGARDGKAPAVPDELDKALALYEKVAGLKPDAPAAYINQRVALTKLVGYQKKIKDEAEAEATAAGKDKDKAAAATTRADAAKAKMEELQKRMETVTAKLIEANKKAAAAPPPAPAPAPAKK